MYKAIKPQIHEAEIDRDEKKTEKSIIVVGTSAFFSHQLTEFLDRNAWI